MSKSKKTLDYIAMACAIIAIIVGFVDQNWFAALWALIALFWMVDSYLSENSYYECKESLDKLTDNYFNSLIRHEKELKELKDEIKKLEE